MMMTIQKKKKTTTKQLTINSIKASEKTKKIKKTKMIIMQLEVSKERMIEQRNTQIV